MLGGGQITAQVDSHNAANLTDFVAELNGWTKRGAPMARLSCRVVSACRPSPHPITDLPHQKIPSAADNFFFFLAKDTADHRQCTS